MGGLRREDVCGEARVRLFEARRAKRRRPTQTREDVPADLSDDELGARLQASMDALRRNVEAVYGHVVRGDPL
jgi:hypothetical protein